MPSTFIATLKSISPLGQSKALQTEKLQQETHDDHDKRVWRDRIHTDASGEVFIPPMALKFALSAAAKKIGMKISGKRGATYTAIFDSGVLLSEPIKLGIKAADVECERLFLNADGKRGGQVRVWRNMPRIDEWKADAHIHVLNDLITDKVLQEHLEYVGMFVGLGFFRPEKGGYWGRFSVEKLTQGK